MVIFSNAKINIGLYVMDKRPDGYHNIESLIVPIALYDVLELHHSTAGDRFKVWGMELPDADNLCIKAVDLLREDYPQIGPVDSYLIKNIPSGAGLAGGSSNASFMLQGLSDLFGLGLKGDTLKKYASQLGSDCPFFIDNQPQLARGRGVDLSPFPLDLKAYTLVLVKPEFAISTREAYQALRLDQESRSLEYDLKRPLEEWREAISNDFEIALTPRFPKIGEIKQSLYDAGALYASMTGAGSVVYGLFETPPETSLFHEFGQVYLSRFL
ncbi:MAG TPA: 4-(cytidine 5'-diphospho)-2-C-methyl-D-erythritol kinase [Candidatus Sphingobacterium stercoripullorum]|uniref:4-diphosphocytidyl-2-C-methyl-D-erythritol kinase n=1 Tax=Candidatus Sphingobacterium stercoripullorum TaxID=2838759 RepID=A0A9D1W8N4_9SPHI|nr:4-(cytidine 5'-diphospho)-2-C-methyl-D-erythritol kinase [Candidatus Sphingobacterium stercoripullorum]